MYVTTQNSQDRNLIVAGRTERHIGFLLGGTVDKDVRATRFVAGAMAGTLTRGPVPYQARRHR
jgi:hypothetical protein